MTLNCDKCKYYFEIPITPFYTNVVNYYIYEI